MAYTKTTWTDRAVSNPTRYRLKKTRGGSKNMLPPYMTDWLANGAWTYTDNYVGSLTAPSATNLLMSMAVPVVIGQTYTVSKVGTCRMRVNKESDTGTNLVSNTGSFSYTFTADATFNGYVFIRFDNNNTAGTFTLSNWMMEIGSAATVFEEMYEAIIVNTDSPTVAGTPLNAANLNKIEQGIADAATTADSALSTANAALPKAGGTVTGNITYLGEVLPQIRKNATTGSFEYYDGTRWRSVSATMIASNNVMISRPTEVAFDGLGAGSSKYQLVAKFIAPGPGEFVISAELYKTGTYGSAYVQVYTGDSSKAGAVDSLDWRTPEGTQSTSLSALASGLASIGTVGDGGATSYNGTPKTATIYIATAGPVYIFAGATTTSQGTGGGHVKNVTVSYDIM